MDEEFRDGCQYRRCKNPSDIIYQGVGFCDRHWGQICSKSLSYLYLIQVSKPPVKAYWRKLKKAPKKQSVRREWL